MEEQQQTIQEEDQITHQTFLKSKIANFLNSKHKFACLLMEQRQKEASYEELDSILNKSPDQRKPKSYIQNDKIKHYFRKGQTIFNIEFPLANLQEIDEQKFKDSIFKLSMNSLEMQNSSRCSYKSSNYLEQLCKKSQNVNIK